MTPTQSPAPQDGAEKSVGAEQLAAALREQGTPADEIEPTVADLLVLSGWPAPAPSPADTRALIARLEPLLPLAAAETFPAAESFLAAESFPASEPSAIRQAVRAAPSGLIGQFWFMLRLVRAQVSLLLPSFWLASLVVVAFGALLTWVAPNLNRSFVLYLAGPLLAYVGTASAFRAGGVNMLEFELACPPSPRQLTLARLCLVLGYDLALGLLLSAFVWPQGGGGFWLLTLHWLMPLLLAVGLTLLLSLRLTIGPAAALAYVGWLAVLLVALVSQNSVQSVASVFPPATELAFGLAGLALMAAVLAALPRALSSMLPHH